MMLTRRTFVISGGMFALTACADTQAPPPRIDIPRITFAHRPAITFDAARVDIQQPFVPSGRAPNVEHQIPNPPARVAERWASDRLRAGGSAGFVRFTILDASIVEVPLKIDRSLAGAFKTQNDTRYDGRYQVRIDVQNPSGTGFAEAIVTRSQSAREDLTLNERDDLMVQFVEEMGRDLDRRLEAEINANLSGFLVRA
ncbi:hypothetical protein [Minwuia sp.]|uniref:hypothetical protein n=1 Tax=Minwuia sp. TaxID=2493630 RepID=UPI003A947913